MINRATVRNLSSQSIHLFIHFFFLFYLCMLFTIRHLIVSHSTRLSICLFVWM